MAECAACRKLDAALRCGICKKSAYCSAACQKNDWPYHKRICSKPKASEEKPTSPSPAPSPTPAPAPAAAPAAPRPAAAADDDGLDEEDRKAIADVKKMGYRYFARKEDAAAKELIGSIAPARVESSGAVAATATVENDATVSKGSAWNQAGTFEERNMLGFVQTRLRELLFAELQAGGGRAPLADGNVLVLAGDRDWEGMANIAISRGKARRIYDFRFQVAFAVAPDAATAARVVAECTASSLDLAAADAAKPAAPTKVTEKPAAAVGDAAAADTSVPATPPPLAAAASASALPRVLLEFVDVSNDSEGSSESPGPGTPSPAAVQREVRVLWGKDALAPPKAQRAAIEAALAAHGPIDGAGPAASVRRAVERVVAEFKSR